MLIKTFSAAVYGISATIITIEVSCTKGIQFFLVGLPDVAVRESHERIVSALQVNGYPFPRHRIVINMAPADIKKEGSAYDLRPGSSRLTDCSIAICLWESYRSTAASCPFAEPYR